MMEGRSEAKWIWNHDSPIQEGLAGVDGSETDRCTAAGVERTRYSNCMVGDVRM
jgi:hypothetical protein